MIETKYYHPTCMEQKGNLRNQIINLKQLEPYKNSLLKMIEGTDQEAYYKQEELTKDVSHLNDKKNLYINRVGFGILGFYGLALLGAGICRDAKAFSLVFLPPAISSGIFGACNLIKYFKIEQTPDILHDNMLDITAFRSKCHAERTDCQTTDICNKI